MELCNLSVIRSLMSEAGLTFRKEFGQNFLINRIIPEDIADNCTDNPDSMILEIGPGIGCLTQELAIRYHNVVAVEIDRGLIPILEKTLAEYDNITVINEDIMKIDLASLVEKYSGGRPVSVCANLPYYITTPILMYLLESGVKFSSITVMIQKEVATRLTSRAGSEEYGAITPTVEYYAEVKKLFDVSPGNFMPRPDVTSSVISLEIRKAPAVAPISEETLFKTIKGAFAQRRKTILNSLSSEFCNLTKEEITLCLTKSNISPARRGETLSLDELSRLSDEFYKITN